jgi:hypothetical protein
MDTELKLTHYQKYKETIIRGVKAQRERKKLQRLLSRQDKNEIQQYNDIVIQNYLKNLIK